MAYVTDRDVSSAPAGEVAMVRLSKTTLVHVGAQGIISLAGFAATFSIAVLEGSDTLGQYAICVSLGGFLLIVPIQATAEAVKKRISEGRDERAFFGVGLLANGVLALALAGGILAVGAGLRTLDVPSAEIVTVVSTYDVEIAALVLASAGFRTVRGGLEGTKRVGTSGLLQALDRVLRTSSQVAALLAGYSVAALVAGHAVAMVTASLVGFWILGVGATRPTREHVRSVYNYAKYAWLGALRTRVFGWFDTFVLSFFVGASLVGIYEAAWGIAALLGVVSLAIRRTLFPEVSELSAQEDFGRIRSILEDGLAFSGIFAIPGFAGAAVVGQRALRFYSPEFGRGAGILVLLVCAYLAESYGSQFVSVLNAVDRPSLAYRVNLTFVLVSAVLTVSLTWAFGWYGAATATASASVFRTALGYRVLAGEIGAVPLPLGEVGRQVLASGVMAVVVFPLDPALPRSRGWTLAVIGVGAAVYVAVLLAISARVRGKCWTLLPVDGR